MAAYRSAAPIMMYDRSCMNRLASGHDHATARLPNWIEETRHGASQTRKAARHPQRPRKRTDDGNVALLAVGRFGAVRRTLLDDRMGYAESRSARNTAASLGASHSRKRPGGRIGRRDDEKIHARDRRQKPRFQREILAGWFQAVYLCANFYIVRPGLQFGGCTQCIREWFMPSCISACRSSSHD